MAPSSTAEANGRLKARPPEATGLSSWSPSTAPSGRMGTNADDGRHLDDGPLAVGSGRLGHRGAPLSRRRNSRVQSWTTVNWAVVPADRKTRSRDPSGETS